ncbi:MAG: hypothetical protein GDA46_05165 [Bdellovibrionales bacterium]|nr:hypothetical protein [Bdellovibrionales bacterium]
MFFLNSNVFLLKFFKISLGEMLALFFQSVYFFNSLDFGYYRGITTLVIGFVVLAIVLFLIYITVKTILMKKNMSMMSTVLNEEGEIIEILDDLGKKGWVLIYGENWRFISEKPVKIGDTVKVLKNKKMYLFVEKIDPF